MVSPLALFVVALAVVIAALTLLSIRRKSAFQKGQPPVLGANGSAGARPAEPAEDPSKPVVRILFGTQTGTAERFSKQLGNELRSRYGDSTTVDVRDVETYKPEERLAREKLLVLCMATYGDGEPTDNAAIFYTWLLKEAEAVESGEKEPFLQGVAYAVFGLGNKQYEHFNAIGKKVFKALKSCGAAPVCRRGDGDDDGVIDDDFEKWCAELYEALDKSDLVGKRADQNGHHAAPPASAPAYQVEVLRGAEAREVPAFPSGSGKDVHSPFWARITTVRELHTSQSDRSCVHAELDVSGSGISYEAGDHVAIYARNSEAVVQQVADLLGFDLAALIKMSLPSDGSGDNGSLPPPLPGPISVRTALSYFADVLSSPHREALAALSTFAADREEAARLVLLGSPAGKAEYGEFIGKPRRSLLEVLQAFPSAKPTIGAFFGCVAPRLQPRFYSISSSPKQHPSSIHVTCAVVRDAMPTGRVHEGIASTWLKRHGSGAAVPVFVRHSHFRLPKSPATPVVMVGPGTGLAPFRGFLQERAALAASGAQLGPAHLFFGCRSRHTDYIYQQELEGHVAAGVLSDLHVAYSRDTAAKDYVQHHVERTAAALWPLIDEGGAHLYVCGDAKHMAKDVHKAFIALVQGGRGCSGTQAEGVVKELTDAGRYQRDVW
ncbi:NADPH--cytochrome P450 reductase 1 [Tetrabaena socialis]|uniref:NADPH--hemoprotein reductase n=1 Tax=Tetrabaena socialis TaxID=47790 RepID=A0A2J8A5Q1_9CHLO|nr:NADPH--cytochrome P450 reductase 1 [Tetrabaena socialis]|eukprot:PNH07830.1 NADPH--cytochrome P450 reductase 1 [Tetrabaena socialis]